MLLENGVNVFPSVSITAPVSWQEYPLPVVHCAFVEDFGDVVALLAESSQLADEEFLSVRGEGFPYPLPHISESFPSLFWKPMR